MAENIRFHHPTKKSPHNVLEFIYECLKYMVVALFIVMSLCATCRAVNHFELVPTLISENVENMYDEGVIDLPKFDSTMDIPDKYIVPMTIDASKWSLQNSYRDLQWMIVIINICTVVGFSSLLLHISNTTTDNHRIAERYNSIRSILDEDDRSEIDNIFKTVYLKKRLNFALTVLLPFIATLCCCLALNSVIQQYGIRVTDNISWIVQEYEISSTEEAMDEFNTVDGVNSMIASRLHTIDANFETTEISAVSGYYIDGTTVINHRSLHNGTIVCIKMDLSEYYKLIAIQIIVLILYLVYVEVKLFENKRIRIN